MADRLIALRKDAGKAAGKVEALCHSLWVTEGRASFSATAEHNEEAEAFAADLGRVLVDHLQPAVDALRKLAEGRGVEGPTAGPEPKPNPEGLHP